MKFSIRLLQISVWSSLFFCPPCDINSHLLRALPTNHTTHHNHHA